MVPPGRPRPLRTGNRCRRGQGQPRLSPSQTALPVTRARRRRPPPSAGPLSGPGSQAGAGAGKLGSWVGRRSGLRLTRLPGLRHFYTPERLAAAERLSGPRGALPRVFLVRFAVVMRMLGGPLAGMHRMPWPWFLVANAARAAVWVMLVVTAGLLIGDNLHGAHALLT